MYDISTWLYILKNCASRTARHSIRVQLFIDWQTLSLLPKQKFNLPETDTSIAVWTASIADYGNTVLHRVELDWEWNSQPVQLPDVTWADLLPMSQACQPLLVHGYSPSVHMLKDWAKNPVMRIMWPHGAYFNCRPEKLKDHIRWIAQQFINWELGTTNRTEHLAVYLNAHHRFNPVRRRKVVFDGHGRTVDVTLTDFIRFAFPEYSILKEGDRDWILTDWLLDHQHHLMY